MTPQQNNIFFSLDESDNLNETSEFDMNELLYQDDNENNEYNENNSELMIPYMMHYSDNFTIKELLMICDYYGIAKELKANKYNKDLIIQYLVEYEINPINNDIVFKRQNMWFYINELKNDKFMKKYILW